MGWQEPETAGQGDPVAGGEHGSVRAADADRDSAAAMLAAAYSEGRLSRGEHDARLDAALSARTYADLDQLVTDLPAAPPIAARNRIRRTGEQGAGLALAGLALGWAAVILGIALIVAGLALSGGGLHGPMRMH